MPETTENYHRIPVSSGHDSHNIRTITVSESQGIKGLYCTDCHEIITYLFDVNKWTMGEAKQWVEDHKEDSLIGVGSKSMANIDRRTKDKIGAVVRYKSYGQFVPKGIGENPESDDIYVRGFFTSDSVDEVGDIITKEATVKAIDKWRKWGNIRTMHDYPSGRVERIGEGDGLAWNEIVTVPVDSGTKELIKGGVLKAYSVGIIPRKYELNEAAVNDEENDFFYPLIIHEYDMVEISYVDHPANYAATIDEVASGKKRKEFEHRSVLFKSSNIDGDITEMEEQEVMESEVVEEEDVNVPVDESVEFSEHEDVEEISDPDAEIENEQESEFDVAMAVQDIFTRIDSLNEQVSSKLDSFVDEVVGRLVSELSENEKFYSLLVERIGNDTEPVESSEVKDSDEKEFDVDAVVEKIIEGVAGMLIPVVSRYAAVTVDEDGNEELPSTPEAKTKYYLEMEPGSRREVLKDILNKRLQR